ncbi:MAG: transcriptional repressor NrdR [Chloroflexi bacterium]|nr:MAG: transcriptional repressor NrdR [Chloroflexota bacterium]
MQCPYCGHARTRVVDTTRDARGGVRRRRECRACGRRFSTMERPLLALRVVKRDGRREAFDREKLLRGIRIACAKRPVATEAIEGLVDRIEARLERMGRAEVDARVIGDLVIEGLKELDKVAYIRYAIVYLGLEDLEAVRAEIDRLLQESENNSRSS